MTMRSALVNPESNRFPNKCPHCLRKAEGTYAIAAMRGLDAFAASYAAPPLLDVPVCREAFERRRTAALVWLVAALLLILAGAASAVWFAVHGAWLAAAVPAVVAAVLAAGGRTGWDTAWLDRAILGIHARSLSSKQARLYFGRDGYYDQWAKLNHVKRT